MAAAFASRPKFLPGSWHEYARLDQRYYPPDALRTSETEAHVLAGVILTLSAASESLAITNEVAGT